MVQVASVPLSLVYSIFSGTLIHWLSHCPLSDLLAVCKHGHVNLMSANMEVTKGGRVFCCHGDCPGSAMLNVHKVEKVLGHEENVYRKVHGLY